MTKAAHLPDRGEIIWINFNPQAGHEQSGRRPAVVLSPRSYNKASGLAVCCPVTSQAKGYPFEVELPAGAAVKGVVLADQIRNLDWRSRKAEPLGSLDEPTLLEIVEKLRSLIILDDE